MNVSAPSTRSQALSSKVTEVFRGRVTAAHGRFTRPWHEVIAESEGKRDACLEA